MLSRSLTKQLGVTICFFIIVVQGIYLFHSYEAKRSELLEIRQVLDDDVMKKAGKRFNDLHPDILSEADIERRLKIFKKDSALEAIVLILVVILGTNLVFYFIVGKPLMNLIRATRGSGSEEIVHFTGDLPKNELGELIQAREDYLDTIEEYQKQLSGEIEVLGSQLNQSAKLSLVGELSAGIIHDINNPLQVLFYYLDKASDSGDLNKSELEKMSKALDRVNSLVKRMTSFVRKTDDKKDKILMECLVKDTLVLLDAKIKKQSTKVELKFDPKLKVSVFKQDFEQVLMNLIANAIDAMESSGVESPEIEIRAEKKSDELIVEILDNGPGVPTEIQSQIFDSFFTTKKDGKGTGLGLSNVSRIVGQMDGSISVQNEQGFGALFRIKLKGA